MPGWLKWLLYAILIAANIYLFVTLQKTRHELTDVRSTVIGIHDFLGTDKSDDHTKWTGYLGTEKQNRKDLRNWLGNLRCRVEKLEKPNQPGGPCAPDGPPGTVPKDNGSYPP